jgi:transcriptional regulator with PAS, ATPase and Fis domain
LALITNAKQIAETSHTVLIQGESGTGKELFAHSIHNASSFKKGPFISVNCASLPRELVESELFGYEKGTFTGALASGHPGKFELANGGTIFLDEIGELPFEMQAKLLRVLDSHRIMRIGGETEKALNIRIIAATNRDLRKEIANKTFREDLFYRLEVMTFYIPPIRDRRQDIGLLANHFLNKLNSSDDSSYLGRKILTDSYIECLKEYSWPGNIRELQNVIVHSYYASALHDIEADCLPDGIRYGVEDGDAEPDVRNDDVITVDKSITVSDFEKDYIERTLKNNRYDILRTCIELGLSKATFYRRVKKYDIKLRGKESEHLQSHI